MDESYTDEIVDDDLAALVVVRSTRDPEDVPPSEHCLSKDHFFRSGKPLCHMMDSETNLVHRAETTEYLTTYPAEEYLSRLKSSGALDSDEESPLCANCWKYSKLLYEEIRDL